MGKILDDSKIINVMLSRMRDMVFNMLHYTKERELNYSKISILDFSKSMVTRVEPKAKSNNIKFIFNYHVESEMFEIDHDMVSQAIVNLLENSIDVCIDDKSEKKEYKITFRIKKDNDNIIFKIKDNGTDIDQKTKCLLYFFSSKRYRGIELDLFVAKNIIAQHKGSIEVNSTSRESSYFSIKLPKVLQNTNNNNHKAISKKYLSV